MCERKYGMQKMGGGQVRRVVWWNDEVRKMLVKEMG